MLPLPLPPWRARPWSSSIVYRACAGWRTARPGLLGIGMTTYTGALMADSAIPVWHESRRHLPAVFASSSVASAGAAGVLTGSPDSIGPAGRAAVTAATTELVVGRLMRRHLGVIGEVYEHERAGRFHRAASAATAVGAAPSSSPPPTATWCRLSRARSDPIEAYRQGRGSGEVYGQATVCFAEDRGTAEKTMLARWRRSAFGWHVNAELPTPGAFADATDRLPADAILGSEPMGRTRTSTGRPIETYREAGFDVDLAPQRRSRTGTVHRDPPDAG